MADLGIARMSNELDLGGTLTRADLADVVHNKLGLSRMIIEGSVLGLIVAATVGVLDFGVVGVVAVNTACTP